MLLAHFVIAKVFATIDPELFTFSVLKVVLPEASVARSVRVCIDSETVGLIIKPLSFENIAVKMPEFPLAASFAIFPHALVTSSVRPPLDTVAVLVVTEPLSVVDSAIFEGDLVSRLYVRAAALLHQELVHQLIVLLGALGASTAALGLLFLDFLFVLTGNDLINVLASEVAADPGLNSHYELIVLLKVVHPLARFVSRFRI